MRVLRAVNLLGDSLYLLKPIAEYRMQSGEPFVIGVGPGFAGDMLRAQFGTGLVRDMGMFEKETDVIDLSAGLAAQVAMRRLLATNERLHISECYAEMLGVDSSGWKRDFTPLMSWANGRHWDPISDWPYVVIAPFSRSCSRHAGMRPNKTPDHERWTPLLEWLRYDRGLEPLILISLGDVWQGLDGVEKTTAMSIGDLARILTGATAVISVDNGIGHIASALGCRTLILWPPITSVDFIGPVWNPRTKLMYMRPERIRADQLLRLVQKELDK